MASCPKCGTLNDGKLTRCRVCNAILPVKLDSALETSAEGITPSKVATAGIACPRCGAANPYSRFKCEQCGTSLTQYKRQTYRDRIWVYCGTAIMLGVAVLIILRTL